jgi:hypothetical protein
MDDGVMERETGMSCPAAEGQRMRRRSSLSSMNILGLHPHVVEGLGLAGHDTATAPLSSPPLPLGEHAVLGAVFEDAIGVEVLLHVAPQRPPIAGLLRRD